MVKTFFVLTILSFLFNEGLQSRSASSKQVRLNHNDQHLSDNEVSKLAHLTDARNLNQILDNLLVPRVVGTERHGRVADYIVDVLKNLGWDVERDEFSDTTPTFGVLEFQNIIARLNPNAERFLVLACHYDSKYFKEFNFVGATDSAVPCAMLLNLAYVLKNQLSAAKTDNNISLLFIFFDGEEAFEQWSSTDSIYGARHLASKWENQISTTVGSGKVTELDKIDALVLLDLIGPRNPTFYSYFVSTALLSARLHVIEERLAKLGLLTNYDRKYFINQNSGHQVEDDHIPFLRRGVPVVHIIPSPFPVVWHTSSDDSKAIDLPTVENLNKILRVFVCEYLHLKLD